MSRYQQVGRQKELTTAHHDFEKGLNSYALFKVSNRELSEDLVQKTFMKTWAYLLKGGEVLIMKAFLYRVLNGLIIDEYRRNKPFSLDELREKGFEPSVDDTERLLNTLDGKAAMLLIQRLPIAYQKVISLRYINNLTLREIALVTGQSKNTTSVQIHRGLEKLKALYNH